MVPKARYLDAPIISIAYIVFRPVCVAKRVTLFAAVNSIPDAGILYMQYILLSTICRPAFYDAGLSKTPLLFVVLVVVLVLMVESCYC